MLRAFKNEDESAVEPLLIEAWPDDPVLREISAIHGVDLDTADRWRRTRVAVEAGEVVGVGTLLATSRHPTHVFTVLAVAPGQRRRGIGSELLAELRQLGGDRRLLARVRETNDAALGFARAKGFSVVMRSRTGVVDPSDADVASWVASAPALPLERGLAREEFAVAHEEAYRAEHETWSPVSERPLEESLRLFCGNSWIPDTAVAARRHGRIAAVAALHGPPLAPSEQELFLIAGSATGDTEAVRAVVGTELQLAGFAGAVVSIEADEANVALSEILSELPAICEPTLLLLGGDCTTFGVHVG